ncbi:PPE family protein [Mycolicibacter icosiumassiliensis]|uniref:PPE family protein n=1 Tax=Mycolicibacter icosiumassiliensis TaxID=1792835 RepID=UPI00083334FF|nr:PPE family protein [Mycolicibacter icosiumassiliensis]
MLDFGALPPEINSARIYFGPGAGPMMAAAAAWGALAAELEVAASSYQATVSELAQSWQGPSATRMGVAAAPYVAWIRQTGVEAEQTAAAATAAAGAYEAAFAATVPPPVIEANRALLMSLIATNFLGQNTPAIAAAEAAYAEMWAQDATAMYTYAASSSTATRLTPFGQPPSTTNSAGQTAASAQAVAGHVQGALAQLVGATPAHLQSLAAAGTANPVAAHAAPAATTPSLLTLFSDFNAFAGPLTPAWQTTYSTFQWVNLGYAVKRDLEANPAPNPNPVPQLVTATPAAPGTDPAAGRHSVLVRIGQAPTVGQLSVPQTWASAAPTSATVAEPVGRAGTGFRALPAWATNQPSQAVPGAPPAIGPMRDMTPAPGKKILAMRDRRFKMPRPAAGG